MTEGSHGNDGGAFCMRERAHGLIALEQCGEMVEVDWNLLRLAGVLREYEPLDNAALDGMSEIVHGVGAVCEAEVDDCGYRCPRGCVAPEEVGWVQIVVRPQGWQCGQQAVEALHATVAVIPWHR